MENDHIVQLPKAVWRLKVIETVVAVIVLGCCAFNVAEAAYSASVFATFTAIFSLITLAYYFIALHAAPRTYNWITLLVFEVFALIFWTVSFCTLAKLYAVALAKLSYSEHDDDGDDGDHHSRFKRSISQRDVDAYLAILILAFAISTLEFIFYCVTLGNLCVGIHRHRKAGKPLVAGGATSVGPQTEKDIERRNSSRDEESFVQ